MLHIHNGDSTAGTLKEHGFPGQHKAFREVLMEGPTRRGLSNDEWIGVRARFLADAYDLKPEKCEQDLREQETWLSEITELDETILWFEHDLFCQINLIYLLNRFSKSPTRLSLICIGEFPGVEDFRGLGQLTGGQLSSLFDKRHQVVESEFHLGSQAWASYCSPDPFELVRLLEGDMSSLPFLGPALHLHLERFPSVRNGLGGVENKALRGIASGTTEFKQLFRDFGATEPYGMGDAQLWSALRRLANARDPLIRISYPGNTEPALKTNRYLNAVFELTETGESVLAGKLDFIDLNGVDLWLGGVHLKDNVVWRWDERNGLTSHLES